MRLLGDTLRRTQAARSWPVRIALDGSLPFGDQAFDRILVDAPCSGLGTVRRDPDIKWRRSAQDLIAFSDLQAGLLQRIAPLLADGGRLIYSTCSSESEENEAVVARFVAEHPQFHVRPVPTLHDLPPVVREFATAEGYWRTFPHRHGLEAFFAAVLERG